MFKVMCLREVNSNPDGVDAFIRVGNTYTVIESKPCRCGQDCGLHYYRLEEGALDDFYISNLFAPLDGPDEIELHLRHVERLTAEYVAKYGEPPIVELDPVAFAMIWEGISEKLDKTGRL